MVLRRWGGAPPDPRLGTAVERIEKGDYLPQPRTVRALAALGVEPHELIAPDELERQGKTAA